MTEMVDVQDTETGRKYTIPAHWLELSHPQSVSYTHLRAHET